MVRQRLEHHRSSVHAMTAADDHLAVVLASTGPVLLDFDGPVTPIFANGRNRQSADEMRAVIAGRGVPLPPAVQATPDPLQVLHYAGRYGDPTLLHQVDETLRTFELRAVDDATPTAGADDFLVACSQSHRPVVIVSNNSTAAIDAYLTLHDLNRYVRHVVGRPHARPDEMKPHPAIIEDALRFLRAEPGRCVLVGDSITDIEVAHLTGIRSIGYVKSPDRQAGLDEAGADATTDSMTKLAEAMRATPALPGGSAT